MRKRHKYNVTMTNKVDPASPASVWGKGVPGKGGLTTNASISTKKTEKENA